MVNSEEVLAYINEAGPVLPKHVADAFSISTLFASAFLSELSSKGLVHTSHLKIGGSPLYYTEAHRARLVDYRGYLHEKEQKTFELLRSERVLDDSALELLDRVALRKMEDFAIPLAVDVVGERRIFWKFYLAPDAEVSQRVSEMVMPPPESEETEPIETDEPEIPEPPSEPQPEPAPEPALQEPTPQPVPAVQEPQKPERQETITRPEPVQVKHAPDASEELEGDKLGERVREYFSERGISILFAEVGRKNSVNYGVCRVPSAIGEVEYYYYAKDKKSITDKDVKEAFAESAMLGYPLLYLAKGDVKKSASELVGSKIKGCVIVEI